MPKPNAALPLREPAENKDPFESGRAAGQAALVELGQLGPMSPAQTQWISGFLQAFVEASTIPSTSSDTEAEPSSSRSPKIWPQAITQPYTARITQATVASACNGDSWLTVTLDVEGSQLTYRPGSTLALWPSNDPEEVRKVLRTLGVSAQLEVQTPRGPEPAWQVLLERVSLFVHSRQTLELLAEHSRSASEAQGLFELCEAGPLPLQGRPLLSLLRRFPSTRPPLDRLLASLQPLQPVLVPIASSAVDAPSRLQFMASIVENPSDWGELGVTAKSRFREGEWVTVSIDTEHEPLPVDDELAPVIVIAQGPCLALARSLVAERKAKRAKGRCWIIGVGMQAATVTFAQELVSWHKSGTLGRYDTTSSADAAELVRLLAEKEESLWPWLVDHSQLCVLTTEPALRQAIEEWLAAMIARRQRVDIEAAKARVRELRAAGRLVEFPLPIGARRGFEPSA